MNIRHVGFFLVLSWFSLSVQAYGGGGSSTAACTEPSFYDEAPARNAKIPSLSGIEITASDITDPATLELNIQGQRVPVEVSTLLSGETRIKAHLPQPITQAGKVMITLTSRSKASCPGFTPYFLQIQP
jgi:hypothetical protein